MSRRALAGGYGPAQKDGSKRPRTIAALPDPRDFALAVMRDESQPMALRASMAKAALPYLHKRGEVQDKDAAPEREPMSDLEVARRIAHIFERAKMEQEKQAQEKNNVAANAAAPAAAALPSPRERGEGTQDTAPRVPCPRDTARTQRAEAEERGRRADEHDPHPGYRWIP